MNNNKDLNQTDIVNMMDMLAAFTIGPHGFSVQIEDESEKGITFQCAVKRSALRDDMLGKYLKRLLAAYNKKQTGINKFKTIDEWQNLNLAFVTECEAIITGIDALLNSSANELIKECRA